MAIWDISPVRSKVESTNLRKEYEKYIETHDLVELSGKIERGEPHEVNTAYGGRGYTYLYPEEPDLGRVKATPVDDTWKLEWEDDRGRI